MSVCLTRNMTSHVILHVFAVLLVHLTDAMNIGCETSRKPDFRAPGRRISEEKCREYDWKRKNYEECAEGAATNAYPYLGLIGFRRANLEDYQFSCLATLISPNFALTVAHCIDLPEIVKARISDPEIVRFGISAEEPAIDAKILKTITHPDYKPPSKGYDIGLLELAEELMLSRFVLPACLWSQPILEVEQVFVPGRSNDLVALTEMPVKLLDRKTCESRLAPLIKKDWQRLKEHQLCGDESLVEGRMCRGSDGAPMINLMKLDDSEDQMPYVLGISSFGSLRCEGLSIYTRVHSFLDWIEKTVWSE